MSRLQRPPVVVGVDGSADSRRATGYAAGEAARRHLPLRLVHGLQPPTMYSAGTFVAVEIGAVVADVRAMLLENATKVHARYPSLKVTTAVIAGYPAAVLVGVSRAASLVVVGSRGFGGLRGMLAGSTGAQVAAHAHAPVIVVRPPAAEDAQLPPDPGTGVLVGVDGSTGSAAALDFAFAEAGAHGSQLTAVYAWDSPPTTNLGPITRRHYDPVEAQEEADRMLSEALAGWQEKYPGVRVTRRAVHSLNPLATLVAQSREAALVVVGARGRGGFAGLRLGSVSDGLVRHAHRPVAVVHAD